MIRHGPGGPQRVRPVGQRLPDARQRSRQVDVVGVQPADHVAARHADALVHRVGQAAVGLGDVAHVGRGGEDLERAVGRAAVDDDVLDLAAVALARTLSSVAGSVAAPFRQGVTIVKLGRPTGAGC